MSEYPTFQEQIQNFVDATKKAIDEVTSGGMLMVSPEVQEKRLLICSSCPSLDRSTSRCTECGCFLQFKTRISTESCPIGKWGEGDDVTVTTDILRNSVEVPTPPSNPKEGDTYMFQGKLWQFKDDEWAYVPQKKYFP